MELESNKSQLPLKKDIDFLIVSYGGGHIRTVLPVAEELIKKGFSVCVFALTTAIEEVNKTNIPFFSYKDLPQANNSTAISYGKFLSNEIENKGIIDFDETIAYLGINFLDLSKQYGKNKARKLWKDKGRQAFNPIHTMTDVLRQIKPKWLITTNSPRSEKAAINAARLQNIKSICICDLLVVPESKWLKDRNFANYLFVINKEVKNMLVKLGRPKEDIIITGNPAFDSIFDSSNLASANQYKKLNRINPAHKVILYASSPEPKTHPFNKKTGDIELPAKIERILLEYVNKNKNVSLILRRHPSQNQNIEISERVFKSNLETSFNVMVHVPDLIIQVASTTGMQAILAKKLLLNIDCSIFTEDTPYTSMGLGVGVDSLEELPDAITKILASDEVKPSEINFETQALKKTVNQIEKLISLN